MVRIPFDNRYLHLSENLFSRQLPTPVKQPQLIRFNTTLAEKLGIDPEQLNNVAGTAVLAGNVIAEGSEPIATVYAGHQFGSWNPQLGDGRAILLGEVIGLDGYRYDLQLKGSGTTPYSRMGDGRSPLGPVLREYIVSEAMAALGVPTTRALAAVTTGEAVVRDNLLPGGILTRVASSHIRIGTFQYFAAREDWDTLQTLADHVIDRHYPQAREADQPYLALLALVVESQAQLVARWQSLGFIHGVMNTDNMLVCGETIDYGPCAFMENYHPNTVLSSIDRGGRYAYNNQPAIAHWNLAWLAQSLLGLIDDDEKYALQSARTVLDQFSGHYLTAYRLHMGNKLGLTEWSENSDQLIGEFLALMAEHEVDFTLGFRSLADQLATDSNDSVSQWFTLPEAFTPWLERWQRSLGTTKNNSHHNQTIRQRIINSNPVFIPRNHLVEQAIEAGYNGDFSVFHTLVERLAKPYDFDPIYWEYAMPATPEQSVTQTFCGT